MNPVYPMNAAWVARLTGDADRATALLTEALHEGTPLEAQAWNDLGVLAAQGGDLGTARADFVQAIATEPDYDLATWNLGVLEARQAGPMILAGQALLADATELNHDLLTRQLAFQGDERVYRIEVSGTQLELARAPGTGAAIGAAAFGAIATVGAIGQLISGLGGNVQETAETVASEAAGRTGRRLRGIGGRLGGGGRRWPSWAAWIPAIVVLTVTTAWTAAWMAPDAFVTAVLIGLVAAAWRSSPTPAGTCSSRRGWRRRSGRRTGTPASRWPSSACRSTSRPARSSPKTSRPATPAATGGSRSPASSPTSPQPASRC